MNGTRRSDKRRMYNFEKRRNERLKRTLLVATLMLITIAGFAALVLAHMNGRLLPQFGS